MTTMRIGARETFVACPSMAANDERYGAPCLDVAPQASRPSVRLSARELEVLALLATGASNKRIADGLALSQATVATHLRRIYQRLGAHTRTQALAYARASGICLP